MTTLALSSTSLRRSQEHELQCAVTHVERELHVPNPHGLGVENRSPIPGGKFSPVEMARRMAVLNGGRHVGDGGTELL